jgi:hypothetical protein
MDIFQNFLLTISRQYRKIHTICERFLTIKSNSVHIIDFSPLYYGSISKF